MMSEATATQLGLPISPPGFDDCVCLGDNSKRRITGYAVAFLLLNEERFLRIRFTVLPDMPYAAIIGSTTLHQYKASMDFGRRVVAIPTEEGEIALPFEGLYEAEAMDQPISVVAAQDIELPPRSETKVEFHVAEGDVARCRGRWGLVVDDERPLWAAKRGLTYIPKEGEDQGEARHFYCPLLNPTRHAVVIRKGQHIARFDAIDERMYDVVAVPEGWEVPICAAGEGRAVELSEAEMARIEAEWTATEEVQEVDLSEAEGRFSRPQIMRLKALILKHKVLFQLRQKERPADAPVCRFRIKDHSVFFRKTRPLSPPQRAQLRESIQAQEDRGIIEKAESPYSSPVLLVPKPGSSALRFCVDLRGLNERIEQDTYTLPTVTEALSSLHGNALFSTLDLKEAFWSIPLGEKERQMTAFNTPDGSYRYKYMPMGLKTASAVFCRYLDVALGSLKWDSCLCYIDDIIVFGKDFEHHFEVLSKILSRLELYGLTLGAKKCHIAAEEVQFLAHKVSPEGVRPAEDKVKAISELRMPENLKELKSSLGLMGYFRRYIKNFSKVSHPLRQRELDTGAGPKDKKAKIVWSEEEKAAFYKLRDLLKSDPILAHPNWDLPFELHTDACRKGLGACLVQRDDQGQKVIEYASRSLSANELNYEIWELEALAAVWAMRHWRLYLAGTKFKILTDAKAARAVLSQNYENLKAGGRLMRWSLAVSEFDYEVENRKGSQNGNADGLSRCPIDDCDPYDEGPTDIVPHNVLLVADLADSTARAQDVRGAAADGAGRLRTQVPPGWTYTDSTGAIRRKGFRPTDSDPLVVPRWCRERLLDAMAEGVISSTQLKKLFWWPRQGGDIRRRRKQVAAEVCTTFFPDHGCELMPEMAGDHEFSSLKEFADHQAQDKRLAPFLKAAKPKAEADVGDFFVGDDGVLRTVLGPSSQESTRVRVVVPECLKAQVLMRYHGLPISGHQGRKRTHAAISAKFWWKDLRKDVGRWVGACKICKARKTPRPMHAGDPAVICKATVPWSEIAMDIIGASMQTAEGYKYILTCQCIFSRWTIAVPLRTKKAKEVGEAIMNHILCKFGKPRTIRTDEGKEFVNAGLRYLCKRWCIEHISTGGYQSQANPVERWHRYVNSAMGALGAAFGKDWDKYLQVVVFNYNISTCESTGYSPYELLFGRPQSMLQDLKDEEALRVEEGAAQSSKEMCEDMEATMERAYEHVRETQRKAAEKNRLRRVAQALRKPKDFEVGDSVMYWEPRQRRMLGPTDPDDEEDEELEGEAVKAPSAWTPKWTGPHQVMGRWKTDAGFRYAIYHGVRKRTIDTHPNKLCPFEAWSDNQPSTSAWLDGKDGYELGGRAEVGSLIAVPLQGGHGFGVGRVVEAKVNGDVLYRWWGNASNNPEGVFQPGWTTEKGQRQYYGKKQKQPSHKPYLGHVDVPIKQRDIIVHSFTLTPQGRLPKNVLELIRGDFRLGGE